MKILVYAHRLEVGGTQTNAIELAAELRDRHGFDIIFFAQPGPMVRLVEEKAMRFLPAPDARIHPSPARMRALRHVVRREKPDLLHVWDWWQCIDAFYGVHLPMRTPMVVSDMMMDLTRILPKRLPTTFGIPALVDQAKATARPRVELIMPPVDTDYNAPGTVDSWAFREQHGIRPGDITLVTVSRLVEHMKLESLIRTINVVGALGKQLPLRLVIVGDGAARNKLEHLAAETNAHLGRSAVVLTGAMLDPRPAYASADVVVGMGGSALRGMAFGKAVIIVGAKGFALPLTPDTASSFYYNGIYGCGGATSNDENFRKIVRDLVANSNHIVELGKFAQYFVNEHYSLKIIGARLAEFCRQSMMQALPFPAVVFDGLRTAVIYMRERRFLTPSRDRAAVEIS